MSKQGNRKCLRFLSEQAKKGWEILENRETQVFVAPEELGKDLEFQPVEFMTFSCLATYRGKEELKLDFKETFFFRKFFKDTLALFGEFVRAGLTVNIKIILPDTEPKETWGWSVPQEELTGYCRMMAEDAAKQLPKNFQILLWSDLLGQTSYSFDEVLLWAERFASAILINSESQFIKNSPEFNEILLWDKPVKIAQKQVAAYALQGLVLEKLFPNAIFLQSEFPAARKDKMYMPLRSRELPIVHPFSLK